MNMIAIKPEIEIGIVPTHMKFVGALVPENGGKLPRGDDGKLLVAAEMKRVCTLSRVKVTSVQIPIFPGTDEDDVAELFQTLKHMGLVVHLTMMVGGGDPSNPEDEDKIVAMLAFGLKLALKHGVVHVASTSIEEWMAPGATAKTGAAYDAAVSQIAKVHARAWRESGASGSCVKAWHIEFLRKGEFATFTTLAKAWEVVKAMNIAVGSPIFKILLDTSHCGDSGLSIPEHAAIIADIAANNAIGIMHASAPTTRGCLSTDAGWIGALLAECAKTGQLKCIFVEIFHHEDPALQALRDLDPGHGIDTTDGRSYTETVLDGLADVGRRLNSLHSQGLLRAEQTQAN